MHTLHGAGERRYAYTHDGGMESANSCMLVKRRSPLSISHAYTYSHIAASDTTGVPQAKGHLEETPRCVRLYIIIFLVAPTVAQCFRSLVVRFALRSPSKMETVRIIILFVALCAYLTALGFGVVSVTTSEWYVDESNTTSGVIVRQGLWIECDIDGVCRDITTNGKDQKQEALHRRLFESPGRMCLSYATWIGCLKLNFASTCVKSHSLVLYV